MLVYYVLIVIPMLIYIVRYIKNRKNDKISLIIFFTLFILLLSLRGIECGTDLKMYSYFFDIFSNSSFETAKALAIKGEIMYYFLNKFVSLIGGNFQFLLFVIAFISLVPVLFFYYKKSENSLLTIALFLTVSPFTLYFSGLRQIIAMGIIVFAFRFVQEKKLLKYCLFVTLAMLFHKSAAICFAFYPLYYAKIKKNWMLFIVPFMIFVFVFNRQIFSFLLHYYNPIYEEMYGYVTSTGQYSFLLLLIVFDIYCFVFPDRDKMNTEFIGYRNLLLLSTFIQLFVPINYIVMRMNYYSLLFIPILIPMVGHLGSERNKKLLRFSVIVMITFFLFYFIYNGYTGEDVLNVFPYVPYWR